MHSIECAFVITICYSNDRNVFTLRCSVFIVWLFSWVMSERSVLMTIMNKMKRTGTHNKRALKAPNRRQHIEHYENQTKPHRTKPKIKLSRMVKSRSTWNTQWILLYGIETKNTDTHSHQKLLSIATFRIESVNEALATDKRTKKHCAQEQKRQFSDWLNSIFYMNFESPLNIDYRTERVFLLIQLVH